MGYLFQDITKWPEEITTTLHPAARAEKAESESGSRLRDMGFSGD
jgi:hypothetical protein